MKPTRSTHPDPNWRYVPADQTNIRKSFKRVRALGPHYEVAIMDFDRLIREIRK